MSLAFVTAARLGQRLGLHKSTVRHWTGRGILPTNLNTSFVVLFDEGACLLLLERVATRIGQGLDGLRGFAKHVHARGLFVRRFVG
jgi:hypothetical protein